MRFELAIDTDQALDALLATNDPEGLVEMVEGAFHQASTLPLNLFA